MKKVKLYNDFINEELKWLKGTNMVYQPSAFHKIQRSINKKVKSVKFNLSTLKSKLDELNIKKYKINDDGSVDVFQDVTIYYNYSKFFIPIKFSNISL
jgi:hypothetical protein